MPPLDKKITATTKCCERLVCVPVHMNELSDFGLTSCNHTIQSVAAGRVEKSVLQPIASLHK
jgi:hypothetical protein